MKTLGPQTPEGMARTIAAGTANFHKFRLVAADRRWRGRLPIPPRAHPLVRELFRLLNKELTLVSECAGRAGIRICTVSDWRYKRQPMLPNFEAMLNALGYELRIVKRRDSAS